MIGSDQNPKLFAGRFQVLDDRSHDFLIDLFERFHFLSKVTFMRRLIGSLDVDANQIVFRNRVDRVFSFRGIVSIRIAGRSGNFDAIPTDQRRQAAKQIDSCDHGAFDTVHFLERSQVWLLPQPPQPNISCRWLFVGRSLFVNVMITKPLLTLLHKLDQHVAARTARKIFGD